MNQEIQLWETRGVKIGVTENRAGDLLVLRCEVPKVREWEAHEILKTIKASIANGLSHVIIDEYEKLLVGRIIDDNYAYLSDLDRAILKRKVSSQLSGQDSPSPSQRHDGESQRKSRVWAKLAEYLEREDEIVVEGFITFRLKEYLESLFDTVEDVVEDYLTEREYREFLRLLRHFMSRQKNPIRSVNVVRIEDQYRLLDDRQESVKGDVARFLQKPPRGMDLSLDDLIVSAVVTLAPETVIWHGDIGGSPCHDLLRDLFLDHFLICQGCHLEAKDPVQEE